MATTYTVPLDIPEELVTLVGSRAAVAAKAKQSLVLTLLREGRISQGKAAALLSVDRWALSDLMVEHDIRSGPESVLEAREDLNDLDKALGAAADRQP